jgi:histidyl-tRNA synthetase
MGLPVDHLEKDGVDVELTNLVAEVKSRIAKKAHLDGITQRAEGLKVSGGVHQELVAAQIKEDTPSTGPFSAPAADGLDKDIGTPVPEPKA